MEERLFLPPRAQAQVRSSAAGVENPSRFGGLGFADHRLVRTPNSRPLIAPLALSPSLHGRAVAGCGSANTVHSADGFAQSPANPVEFGTMACETVEKGLNVLKPRPRAFQVSKFQIAGNGFSIHDSSRLPLLIAVNGGTVSVALRFPPKTTRDATGQLATKSSSSNPTLDILAAHSDRIQSVTSYACHVESVESQENQNTPFSTYANTNP